MQNAPAFYIGEHIALDLLNSVCAPNGETIEWLDDGAGLISWMVDGGLLTRQTGDDLSGRFDGDELNHAADEARKLREAFRALVLKLETQPGAGISDADLTPINHWLEVPMPGGLIGTEDGAVTVSAPRLTSADQLLRLLADTMFDFLLSADHQRVRQCEGPTCTLHFMDLTKNRSRRWCTMSVCGNRAKAARFRKQKSQSGQA